MTGITTKEDGIRVICEQSYLTWYQEHNPTFYEAIKKVAHECNCTMVDKTICGQGFPTYTYQIYDINITISQMDNHLVRTEIQCGHARWTWIAINNPNDDLWIPYFNDFLKNTRKMWNQWNRHTQRQLN